MTDPQKQTLPFQHMPAPIEMAHYFWESVILSREPSTLGVGQYHGYDGIRLWRNGKDYCYLWVQSTIDHDMWMAYLLEVRTSLGDIETRDHLYLAAGGGGTFEAHKHNNPVRFDASTPEHIKHHQQAMEWFIQRDLATILAQNGQETPADSESSCGCLCHQSGGHLISHVAPCCTPPATNKPTQGKQ